MRYAPYLIGLAGCFLTDSRYTIGNESFSTRIAGEYGGWSVLLVLFLFAGLTAKKVKLKKPDSPFVAGIAGIYLLGFALFRAWHTFTLYAGAAKDSLASQLGANAMPGEGLFLLVLSGGWLLAIAYRERNSLFSTPVE